MKHWRNFRRNSSLENLGELFVVAILSVWFLAVLAALYVIGTLIWGAVG